MYVILTNTIEFLLFYQLAAQRIALAVAGQA
jgi:hypothetical protein